MCMCMCMEDHSRTRRCACTAAFRCACNVMEVRQMLHEQHSLVALRRVARSLLLHEHSASARTCSLHDLLHLVTAEVRQAPYHEEEHMPEVAHPCPHVSICAPLASSSATHLFGKVEARVVRRRVAAAKVGIGDRRVELLECCGDGSADILPCLCGAVFVLAKLGARDNLALSLVGRCLRVAR
jgi:hypothetical protein